MAVSRQGWRHKANQQRSRAWHSNVKPQYDAGLRLGFRSGLEAMNGRHLLANGLEAAAKSFEQTTIQYVIPASVRKYTPDFTLPNGIIVETKGKFETADRAKHALIKQQHPELDIRFVFQRPSDRISKGSKTTYAKWCEDHGFKWATKLIPISWWLEPPARGVGPGFDPASPRFIQVPQETRDLFTGPPRFPDAPRG